ncbi:MAG: aspartyl protease family protein [Phycisphaerales bacterium]|nr:aspartyl protease family protein [Phycisphaerales bacterium]
MSMLRDLGRCDAGRRFSTTVTALVLALAAGPLVVSARRVSASPPPATPVPDSATVAADSAAAPESDDRVVLPTRRCGDLFIAETMIDGKGPFSMVLDTGASVTAITPKVAAETGARSALSRLAIGRFEVSGRIRCQVRNLDELSLAIGTPIDGILGHQVFHQALLTYDYPAREVRVRVGSLTDDMPGVAPMSTSKRPFIGAVVDGRTVNVLLDTGSSQGLSLAKLDRYAREGPVRAVGMRAGVDGLTELRAARLAGTVRFGALVLERPVVHEATSDNLLGQAVLRDFVVTLDQQRGRVQIVRPDGTAVVEPVHSPALYGLGAALEPVPDGLRVRETIAGSAAAERLQPGDVIVAIDGMSIADLGCARSDREDGMPATSTLRVKRGTAILDISITTGLQVP